MKLFAQPKGVRFSNKYLIMFFLPIFFEQLMLAGFGFADTLMVSSKLGTTALAGVALVQRVDNFAKQFLMALGQGGSVVLAQYIGAADEKNAKKSMKTNIYSGWYRPRFYAFYASLQKTMHKSLFRRS